MIGFTKKHKLLNCRPKIVSLVFTGTHSTLRTNLLLQFIANLLQTTMKHTGKRKPL